jgi:hypothetical protein
MPDLPLSYFPATATPCPCPGHPVRDRTGIDLACASIRSSRNELLAILGLALLLLASGCAGASRPAGDVFGQAAIARAGQTEPGVEGAQQLRQAYDAARTREYPEVDPEQAMQAATRIFELAQAGYRVLAGRGGVVAWRERSGFEGMFSGSPGDYWYVDVLASGSGSVLRLRHTREPDPHTSLRAADHGPGTGRLIAPQTIDPQETWRAELTESAALHAIFFKRMDWLLGRNQYWLYCRAAEEYVKMEKLPGSLDPLCLQAGDKRP